MKTPEGPVWRPVARMLAGDGHSFLPFTVGAQVPPGNACLPFYLYPEHRDLVHWQAVNDAGAPKPTRPPHGGYPDAA